VTPSHVVDGVGGYGHAVCRQCYREPLTYRYTNRPARPCCECGKVVTRYQITSAPEVKAFVLKHCPALHIACPSCGHTVEVPR
jgi:endogenous inhibitor of DNA gyrase (YacG/DUF329 family)